MPGLTILKTMVIGTCPSASPVSGLRRNIPAFQRTFTKIFQTGTFPVAALRLPKYVTEKQEIGPSETKAVRDSYRQSS
jgi:hypothetical protein